MANESYRIKANIGQEEAVRLKLSQDINTLEILSLRISQNDAYKFHSASYGMVVGRVLANEAFGIPNAKVSIFIPISDEDKENANIRDIYPYTSINSTKDNIRYNLLPNSYSDSCQKVIGTFPDKRYVLDDNTQIEIFDKYWKYTTVTNASGDYLLFGIPVGSQEIHVDIDLSDVGILSQKPRDFIYKGYNMNLFDNAEQFKDSTNLDNLSQVITQTQAVTVYPFWGDTEMGDVVISRCDVQVQYKFEPTCVFFGSVVTDDYSNDISWDCSPSEHAGRNKNLISSEGTIEMIRQTPDGLVEEFPIQGNKLIDGDGVFCYQIPMNLDYVATDEYGNIIPTDNPKKGIPTRTRVRFRMSLSETGNEGMAKHRAKILVPNNPILADENNPRLKAELPEYGYEDNTGSGFKNYSQWHEFGSATRNSDFRDLYWNNVYSVKSYIPRLQVESSRYSQRYTGLKSCNWTTGQNPIPYNNIRIRLPFLYKIVCILVNIVAAIIASINIMMASIIWGTDPLFFWFTNPFKYLFDCIVFDVGIDDEYTGDGRKIVYSPGCVHSYLRGKVSDDNDGAYVSQSIDKLSDAVQVKLAEDFELVHLDLVNDWINGTIYFPLWFWRKRKKSRFFFGLFSRRAYNHYCNCDNKYNKFYLSWPCSLNTSDLNNGSRGSMALPNQRKNSPLAYYGIIKEHINKAGLKVYYYSPGNIQDKDGKNPSADDLNFRRLFATDIILMGSFNKCSLNPIPDLYKQLPSTTVNIPQTSFSYILNNTKDDEETGDDNFERLANKGIKLESGMDVRLDSDEDNPPHSKGLFYDIECFSFYTFTKTCVNAARACELGVVLDKHKTEQRPLANGSFDEWEVYVDGMITQFEINDYETRAMFASMNHNGLEKKVINPQTLYTMYDLDYLYPTNFDGRLKSLAPSYTNRQEAKTYDEEDFVYTKFRWGNVAKNYRTSGNNRVGQPLTENSFYFYFGIKDGSTAINKLLKNYASDCYQQSKEFITFEQEVNVATWCANDVTNIDWDTIDEDTINNLASVKISFQKIVTNYTIKLVDDYGNTLSTSGNKADYKLATKDDDGNWDWSISEKDSYNLDDIYFIGLHNSRYTLTITDSMGRSIDQIIEINAPLLNAEIETAPLGIKYYSNETNIDDICTEGLFGEVVLKSLEIQSGIYNNLEGFSAYTETVNGETFEVPNEYLIEFSNSDGNTNQFHMKLEISSLIVDNEETMPSYLECSCKGSSTDINYDLTTIETINDSGETVDSLQMTVWRPSIISITLIERCDDKDLKNISSFVAKVENGSDFNLVLNEVPTDFIRKSELYTSNPTYSWIDINNINKWSFYEDGTGLLTEKCIKRYENYVNGVTEIVDPITKEVHSDFNGNFEVVKFKLQSVLNLTNAVHISNNSSATLDMEINGGKFPLLNTNNPLYTAFNETYNKNKPAYPKVEINRKSQITCEDTYPNIVFNNYSFAIDSKLHPYKFIQPQGDATLNQRYIDYNNLGNYFAGFSFTDGSRNPDKITKKVPEYSEVLLNYNEDPNDLISTAYNSKAVSSYFNVETVDRRVDYSVILFEPYGSSYNKKFSGFLSASTYNGVQMIYDDNYNIISNPLEHGYNEDTDEYERGITSGSLEYHYDILGKSNDEGIIDLQPDDTLNVLWNDNHEYRKKKERFFAHELSIDGEKHDIRGVYGNAANGWINVADVTKTDAETVTKPFGNDDEVVYIKSDTDDRYWGELANDKKPIRRSFQLANIPPCDKISIVTQSCSTNTTVKDKEYADSTDTESFNKALTCRVKGANAIECVIPFRNSYASQNRNLTNIVENHDMANVAFVSTAKRDEHFTDTRFHSYYVALQQGTPSTSVSNKSFTYAPFITSNVEKIYEKMHEMVNNGTFNRYDFDRWLQNRPNNGGDDFGIYSRIDVVEDTLDNLGTLKDATVANYVDRYCSMQDKRNKFTKYDNNMYSWISDINSTDNSPVWDDSTTSVKYVGREFGFLPFNNNANLRNNDLVIGTIKHYIDGDDDNLTKEIVTYNFGMALDTHPVRFELIASWLENGNVQEEAGEEGEAPTLTATLTQKLVFRLICGSGSGVNNGLGLCESLIGQASVSPDEQSYHRRIVDCNIETLKPGQTLNIHRFDIISNKKNIDGTYEVQKNGDGTSGSTLTIEHSTGVTKDVNDFIITLTYDDDGIFFNGWCSVCGKPEDEEMAIVIVAQTSSNITYSFVLGVEAYRNVKPDDWREYDILHNGWWWYSDSDITD